MSNVAGGITETDPEAIIYLIFNPPRLLENDKKKQVLKLVLQRVVRTDLGAGVPTELRFCLAELNDLH